MATTGRDARGPGPDQAGRLLRAVVRLGRRATAGTFVVLAVVGAVVGPIWATLVWGPVTGLLTATVVRFVTREMGEEATARRAALVAGGLGLLSPPFFFGLGLLGDAGAVVLVVMMVVVALSVVAWSAESPAPTGVAAARRDLVYLRRVLPELPVESLLREWRASSARITAETDPAVRAVAVELRGDLLDELIRRRPAEMARWLRTGEDGPDQWLATDGSP